MANEYDKPRIEALRAETFMCGFDYREFDYYFYKSLKKKTHAALTRFG